MDFFKAYENMQRGAKITKITRDRKEPDYYFIQDGHFYCHNNGFTEMAKVTLDKTTIECGWKLYIPIAGIYKLNGEFFLYNSCWNEWDYETGKWSIANVGLCDSLDKYAEFYSSVQSGVVRISYDI